MKRLQISNWADYYGATKNKYLKINYWIAPIIIYVGCYVSTSGILFWPRQRVKILLSKIPIRALIGSHIHQMSIKNSPLPLSSPTSHTTKMKRKKRSKGHSFIATQLLLFLHPKKCKYLLANIPFAVPNFQSLSALLPLSLLLSSFTQNLVLIVTCCPLWSWKIYPQVVYNALIKPDQENIGMLVPYLLLRLSLRPVLQKQVVQKDGFLNL